MIMRIVRKVVRLVFGSFTDKGIDMVIMNVLFKYVRLTKNKNMLRDEDDYFHCN